MKLHPLCYGVRRLNPFQGTLQVVKLGDARALSLDGIRWEIQVRYAQPEQPWGTATRREPVMCFLRFGVWSTEAGLRRMPVSPILDLDLLLDASAALTKVLPDCLATLPFAPADRRELWLLDHAGLPFALLASSVHAQVVAGSRPEPWAASARSDHNFQSPSLLKRGVPARHGHDPRRHATLLERLIRDTSGRPARFGWFERDEGGEGSVADSEQASGDDGVGPLAAEDFPPLLLREDWPKPADRDLVRDYLNWCAPFLLTLPVLDEQQRDRLEYASKAHALQVDALYRLYPKILNADLLKSIRVEARMRQARFA